MDNENEQYCPSEDDLTGSYLAAPDGEILLCNQVFANTFGFQSRSEAIGCNLAELYLEPISWSSFVRLLTENKVLKRYKRVAHCSDGTVRYLIETILGTFSADGKLVSIKGFVFDDTDSKIANAKLQQRNQELKETLAQRTVGLLEKNEQLQAIWDSAFDSIITIDRKGIIVTANRATERMFGYSSSELIGQNVSILMPKPFSSEHNGYIQRYHSTGQARILNSPRELVALHKDGSTFPIDLSVTQVEDTGYFTGIIRDVSDRKQLQQHVLEIISDEQRRIGRELHDNIGQQLAGLSLTAGALMEILSMIPQVTAESLVRQLNEPTFARIHDAVSKINRRLAECRQHIQELSHGIMPVQIDAAALQAALEDLAQSTNMPPALTCRFNCPHPVTLSNNSVATHLFRIAQEAVSNALRHSQASEIVLSLKQSGRELVLEVADNGVGIEQTYNQLVQPRKDKGMGMRTMQYRAGILGGTLQVERRKDGGTSVKCISLVSS